MYKIDKSNVFHVDEVTGGRKGYSEYISLKKSQKDCSKKRNVAAIKPLNARFLYPLETENLTVFCFQGVEIGCIGKEWIKTAKEILKSPVSCFIRNFCKFSF